MFWEEIMWNNFSLTLKREKTDFKELGEMIEKLYRKHGENELFRTEFEAFLIQKLEESGDIEVFRELFSRLPLSKDVKRELLQDLEEAYKTLQLKKELSTKGHIIREKLERLCR